MLFVDGTVREYIVNLASGEPTPGGGSAAALAGALGAALTHMVGSLTEGREKYAEHAEFNAKLLEQTSHMRGELLSLVDEDTAVFNVMSDAYKMPKATAGEKSARSAAIQSALKACAVTPYKVMDICARALELTAEAMGKTNINVVSDLGVAALCLKTAAQSAWLNVLINLSSLKDAEFVAEYDAKARVLLERLLPIADSIYDAVLKDCAKE